MAKSTRRASRKSQDVDALSRTEVHLLQGDVYADAKADDDGRFDIAVSGESNELEKLVHQFVLDGKKDNETPIDEAFETLSIHQLGGQPMNIVVQVVGSRGDVQPFVALCLQLKADGHRVRLATHAVFKSFVEEHGLEFFCIGGDPAELMAFMVKNPGLIPSVDTLRSGEIGRRRKVMKEILEGCWRSCIEPGDGTPGGDVDSARPFVADAIIANPPSFAHLHCAERLHVPLHVMFTMPWSPTESFPHPLANVSVQDADPKFGYFLSYALVETLTWQGLGDLINKFREDTLGLGPLETFSAPGVLSRLKIPHTYMWSPALVPKPNDWGRHITVTGFSLLALASQFQPPEDLAAFLKSGPPPVYIGFGSIVVDDPDGLTKMIVEAVKKTGVRALVSQGWGGLKVADSDASSAVFTIGNCPHDWLFQRVSCVVHHGGAGTTAAGISAGKPTVVVPFFGDQKFWGDMVNRAGAGPAPIPYKELTADKLAEAIQYCLAEAPSQRAKELQSKISNEDGARSAVSSFYSHLQKDPPTCGLISGKNIAWRVRKRKIRLSAPAAAILISNGLLREKDLKLDGPVEYTPDHGAFDPLSGTTVPAIMSLSDVLTGFSDVARGTYTKTHKRFGKRNSKDPTSSRDRSRERPESSQESETTDGGSSTTPPDSILTKETSERIETSHEKGRTTKGLVKMSSPFLKGPMTMTVGVAQGLHNFPELYGDRTVRPLGKVDSLKSGLVAGGKEFGFGIYDGFSGIVTQPMKGQKEEGTIGIYKGIAKGLGGVLFKPLAGLSGLFGFTMKGVYEELRRHHGHDAEAAIRVGRLAEGLAELEQVPREEQEAVIERWRALAKKSK